jgi:Zn-dependent M28 family amino/carboxypeptidase
MNLTINCKILINFDQLEMPKASFIRLNFIALALVLICQISYSSAAAQDSLRLIQDLQALCNDQMEGRIAGTAGHKQAITYIQNRFAEIGLAANQPNYLQNSNTENGVSLTNVEGYLAGEGDKYIVITAHYDHIGIKEGKLYPGCDDNASGVAALFLLAEELTKSNPKHNFVFLALDGEEIGLLGAKAWLQNTSISKGNILLNINLDMVSKNDKNEIYVAGTSHYPSLKPIIEKLQKNQLGIDLKIGHDKKSDPKEDWTFSSDHGVFHKSDIPFLYFGVEDHPYYHKPTDTFETTNYSFYYRAVRLISIVAQSIDQTL